MVSDESCRRNFIHGLTWVWLLYEPNEGYYPGLLINQTGFELLDWSSWSRLGKSQSILPMDGCFRPHSFHDVVIFNAFSSCTISAPGCFTPKAPTKVRLRLRSFWVPMRLSLFLQCLWVLSSLEILIICTRVLQDMCAGRGLGRCLQRPSPCLGSWGRVLTPNAFHHSPGTLAGTVLWEGENALHLLMLYAC